MQKVSSPIPFTTVVAIFGLIAPKEDEKKHSNMVLFGRRKQTLAAEMRLMMAYFAAFDGKSTWETIEPVVDATLHDDLKVKEGNGDTFDKSSFKERLQNFVKDGGSMEILKIKQSPLGIHYELTFHKPGSTDYPTKTFASFADGKLIRVERDHIRKPNTIL